MGNIQPPEQKSALTVYLQLSRWPNVVIGMLSIFVGAWVTGTIRPLPGVVLACISGGMITAAANAINDFFDIEIDRINKPHRPLPAGYLKPHQAFVFSLAMFASGSVIGYFISPVALVIAVGASILLFLYSSHLKRTILWGNFVVSLISGMAFIYGGVAVGRLRIALIPAVFAFLFHFGREILKDMEDQIGDQSQNARTFPIRFGINPSRVLITLIFLVLIGATIVPFWMNIFGLVYLVVVVVGVDAFLIFVILSLWKDPSRENLHRLSEWLKADMLVGLLSVVVGVYWP